MDYAEHFHDLAGRLDITVLEQQCAPFQPQQESIANSKRGQWADEWLSLWGVADVVNKLVYVPSIYGELPYFTAMHELGHTQTVSAQKLRDNSLLGILSPELARVIRTDREIAAWQWAVDNALAPPTPPAVDMINAFLATYTPFLLQRPVFSDPYHFYRLRDVAFKRLYALQFRLG